MTAILDRQLSPCAPVLNGTGCPRLTLTTTVTTPRASDDSGCALTGGDCPSNQATIDTCTEC